MKKQSYIYNATVLNVVDGDTIDVTVDMGFSIYQNIRLRLNGIDTKETNDPDPTIRELGLKAKNRVKELLTGQKVVLETFKNDKYGRLLADVYVDTMNVNQQLITEGLATPYFGGKK